MNNLVNRLFSRLKVALIKGTENSLSYIKQPYFYWSSFWLIVVSSILAFFLIKDGIRGASVLIGLYGLRSPLYVFWAIVCALILLGIFIYAVEPSKQLSTQNLHGQPSWVFYFYWGTINAFIFYGFFLYFHLDKDYWYLSLFVSLAIIFISWLNEILCKEIDLTFRAFSAGAVGGDDDKLGFQSSAKNEADGLLRLKNYVNVVGLYGDLGSGKSSYTRMIVENLNPKKTLYTYISLTETNEAKDFSKLFADRWLETLSCRYPKIDITASLPFMDSILRESGNGILSEVLNAISAFNSGLAKTKAYFFDQFYSKNKPVFASRRVAKLFGNITDIKESVWVIVVDEIERAQFDEIYRLVEIVERFKNEGRSGLPTKLIFLFCISEPELSDYLKSFAHIDPRAKLLMTFFFESKSITDKIFLPPVEPRIKENYIIGELDGVIKREGIEEIGTVTPHLISDPSTKFLSHKDAIDYILAKLKESSPRVINRVVSSLDFFYGAFKNRAGVIEKNAIRFSDIVALEYIKIKFPFLIDFFTRTIHPLINEAEQNNLDSYFLKERLEKEKTDIIGWIQSTTGFLISEADKPEVLKLVGLVMYFYFDFIDKNKNKINKDLYFGTTSYPEIMHDYLTLISDGIETSYRKNNQLYQLHERGDTTFLSQITNVQLLSYTRFLYDVPSAVVELHMDALEELKRRILGRRIKAQPLNIGNSLLDDAIFQFTFQIVVITEKDMSLESPSENLQKVFITLKKVLSSKIPVGVKYMILSSLVDSERGSGSEVHYRLVQSFGKIMKYFNDEMRDLIKLVFTNAESRYLTGKQVIYKYEENFFYTLYQGWSGSKDAVKEIEMIRNAAKRHLKDYPEALKIYWDRYPYDKNWRTLKDVLDKSRLFSYSEANNGLYMPLATLLEVSRTATIDDEETNKKIEFWGSIEDEVILSEKNLLKDDSSTLRSFLIRYGYLPNGIDIVGSS